MTRINCVPPSELSRQHLIAEYRELPRVFALVRKAIERGERPDDPRNPTEYKLGTGHVRFFYNKLTYVYLRQAELIGEMRRRGYHPSYDNTELLFFVSNPEWWGEWEPTPEALALNRQRINERNSTSGATSATLN